MINKPPPDVLEAMKIEGFLGKAHPKTGLYQTRYCKIIEDGRRLGYSKSEEDYKTGNINGYIIFKDIQEIKIEDTKVFGVLADIEGGRTYHFKAKSSQERDDWIHALNKVHTYALEWDKKWEVSIKALDPGFVVETVVEVPGQKTEFFLLQPIGLIKENVKKIVVEGAVGTAVGIVKKGVGKVGELLADLKPKPNEDYLKAKKFDHILSMIDHKILKTRLKMGFLFRESKEMTGLGLVDNLVNDTGIRELLARRWCLLISSKPLTYEEVDPSDNETLDRGKIPPELDFDTLYLYDEICDASGPIDVIPLKDVFQVVLKKKLKTSEQYKFVLDLANKKCNLLCASFLELDEWLRAIAGSRITLTEHQYSALPTLKNIHWILETFYGKKRRKGTAKQSR